MLAAGRPRYPRGLRLYVPAGRFALRHRRPRRAARLGERGAAAQRGDRGVRDRPPQVTWADHIEFLSALPAGERTAILAQQRGAGALGQRAPHRSWRRAAGSSSCIRRSVYTARTGEPLVYEGRTQRARVEWERLPVTGIGVEEATAYFAWLNASGRVPGARFCNEHEWERAARGRRQPPVLHRQPPRAPAKPISTGPTVFVGAGVRPRSRSALSPVGEPLRALRHDRERLRTDGVAFTTASG